MSFPPFFPHSKFLNKQPWHHLIWILSVFYASCSMYSALLTFIILFERIGFIPLLTIPLEVTTPMTVPLFPLMLFSYSTSPTPGETVIHGANPASTPFLGNPPISPDYSGLLFLIFYFVLSIFLPSIIYQIILHGHFGKHWRK